MKQLYVVASCAGSRNISFFCEFPMLIVTLPKMPVLQSAVYAVLREYFSVKRLVNDC